MASVIDYHDRPVDKLVIDILFFCTPTMVRLSIMFLKGLLVPGSAVVLCRDSALLLTPVTL